MVPVRYFITGSHPIYFNENLRHSPLTALAALDKKLQDKPHSLFSLPHISTERKGNSKIPKASRFLSEGHFPVPFCVISYLSLSLSFITPCFSIQSQLGSRLYLLSCLLYLSLSLLPNTTRAFFPPLHFSFI